MRSETFESLAKVGEVLVAGPYGDTTYIAMYLIKRWGQVRADLKICMGVKLLMINYRKILQIFCHSEGTFKIRKTLFSHVLYKLGICVRVHVCVRARRKILC